MTQVRVKPVVSEAEVKNSDVSAFLSKHAHVPIPNAALYSATALQAGIELALHKFKASDEFKKLNLENFPATVGEIEALSKFIAGKVAEINKAVYLLKQFPDEKQKLECCKYYKTLHDYLVTQKIFPPVFPASEDKKTESTQVLFWSSGLGESAAKAYSKYVSAGGNLTLLTVSADTSLSDDKLDESIDWIVDNAKTTKTPLLIKQADKYVIFGYREDKMQWDFTELDDPNLNLKLPFPPLPPPVVTTNILREEFGKYKDLTDLLKKGHTSFGAVTDTTAGTKYINDLYGYTQFKSLYEEKDNELLKDFYWRAISYIYASEVAYSSAPPVVYIMDTLTENNYFTDVELPILRLIGAVIDLKRIANKLESSTIVIPGEVDLSERINSYAKDEKGWSVQSKKDPSTGQVVTTLHLDLYDKTTSQKAGSITMIGNKISTTKSDGTKDQKREYTLLVSLDPPKPVQKSIALDKPEKILALWDLKWRAEIQKEMSLEDFYKMRKLVKSTEKYKKRASISVPSFDSKILKEFSSPTHAVKKSQKLGIAYELPINHTWLHAYVKHKANPGVSPAPVFGPLYYVNTLDKMTDQAEKKRFAMECMRKIMHQLKIIHQIIESDFPANPSDPNADKAAIQEQRLKCYQAFCQIITDSHEAINQLEKQTAKPNVEKDSKLATTIKSSVILEFRKSLTRYEINAVDQIKAVHRAKNQQPPPPPPLPKTFTPK